MQVRTSALAIAYLITGCATTPPPVAPAVLPAPSASELITRSHDVIAAFYRNDAATLERVLAPQFVKFEREHVRDRASLLAQMAQSPPHPPYIDQAWRDERVEIGANTAVYIGMSVEHELDNHVHGNREYDGWYTVVWTRDHAQWQVSHWSWQPHHTELDSEREVWNDTYRQSVGFEHQPNRLLVDTTRGVAPGAALDVMMGQGRNALYLAGRGWRTTGIDISDEGLRLAREAAAAQHVELSALDANAESYDYGVAKWDLVTMIYAGDSTAMIEKIKPSLKPGGRFVYEYFYAGPDKGGSGLGPEQFARLFADGFDIVRNDLVDDVPDWAHDRAKLVRFVARKR